MNVMKVAADYAIKHQDRADFKHSSGYAKAQSGDNFGAASVASFEARKAINESRKFVQGYGDSKIGTGRYQGARAKKFEPQNSDFGVESQSATGENKAANLENVAEERAKFTTNNKDKKPGVVLGDAKAPQIPNRRSGI